MTVKEYLGQIRAARRKIERDIDRLAELEALATSIGGMDYSADRVQKTPEGGMPKVEKIVDYKALLEAEVAQYLTDSEKIIGEIEALDDESSKDILYFRYIKGEQWHEIAERMHISEDTAYKYHGEALRQFGAKYLGTGQ